jgi:hypothetical protein
LWKSCEENPFSKRPSKSHANMTGRGVSDAGKDGDGIDAVK